MMTAVEQLNAERTPTTYTQYVEQIADRVPARQRTALLEIAELNDAMDRKRNRTPTADDIKAEVSRMLNQWEEDERWFASLPQSERDDFFRKMQGDLHAVS